MFEKPYQERLLFWRELRDSLEVSKNPIQDTIDFYNCAPHCSIATDPYTPSS